MITIITAAWRLDGVKKVIESVDNQTYKNWQHIIINDNSPELREWYKKEGYRHFENEKRHWVDLGIHTGWFGGIVRNIGAMMAFCQFQPKRRDMDNEWICFLDDDNLWYSNHLETMVKGHKLTPEATLIGVDMEKRGCGNRKYSKLIRCTIASNQCDLGNFLYNRKLFERYGYFMPRRERLITWDYELIEKMAKGEGEDKIIIVHEPTFIYYSRK